MGSGGSNTLYANHHWEVWEQVGAADFEVVVAVGRKRLIPSLWEIQWLGHVTQSLNFSKSKFHTHLRVQYKSMSFVDLKKFQCLMECLINLSHLV